SQPERIAWIINAVLDAVARDVTDVFLPLLARPRPTRALAEGLTNPRLGPPQLTLGELVADCAELMRRLRDLALEPIALRAYFGGVAELALELGAPPGDGVKLAIVALEGARQVSAIARVGITLPPEAPSGLWQVRELLGELLALGPNRARTLLKMLNASELMDR